MLLNIVLMNMYFRGKSTVHVPDAETRKLYSWPVYRDPKGTKKIQMVYEKPAAVSVEKPQANKRVKKRKSKKSGNISVLRGSADGSDDDWDLPDPSATLRSPARRAPTVPGLGLSPQPPADTPNRMRQRRRSAQQLRCRNAGCPEVSQTFSSIIHRRRHEEERCLARIQVYSF